MRALLVYPPSTTTATKAKAIEYLEAHGVEHLDVGSDTIHRLSAVREVHSFYLFGDFEDWPEASLWLQIARFADKILIRERKDK